MRAKRAERRTQNCKNVHKVDKRRGGKDRQYLEEKERGRGGGGGGGMSI